MLLGNRIAIPIVPGVNPITDSTELDTLLFTEGDKIRFQLGKLRKMKGCQRIFDSNNQQLTGYGRNIFSYRNAVNDPVTLIGTNTRLYAYYPNQSDQFYNITPLQTSTTNIQAAFSTEYNSLVSVSVDTISGSAVITLNITNYFEDNDEITISGVSGGPFNGIPASAFNGVFPVYAISNSQIQITVGAAATSSGAVSVTMTWSSSYLYVLFPANGLPVGDRVGILLSDAVGGIPAASINIENYITNVVDTNTFIIQTDTFATSSVTGGGGNSTTIQTQIAAGLTGESTGYGFGSNQFGAGLFGIVQPGPTNINEPRIWSMDNFGDLVILTPGDPAATNTDNLYVWANDVTIAPVLVSGTSGASNVPVACKWVYVSNNTVVVLGVGGVLNQYQSSDVVNYNIFTPGAATYSYTTILQNASALISQAKARNYDIVFTLSEVYQIEFVDKPDIWFFRKLFSTDGIIGPKARAKIEDSVFWMGQGDFYVFDGYTVNPLPNNTLKRYVYDNINQGQSWKCFAFANVEWSEVWFFYPAGQDIECNNYVIYNYKEFHWTTGTWSRTAAEEPVNVNINPLMIQSGTIRTIPIPNSISTYFYTLGNNPLTTSNSSALVQINITSLTPVNYWQVGDTINIAGAIGTNGISGANINGPRTIAQVIYSGATQTVIIFTAGANASGSGAGGGSGITLGLPYFAIDYIGASGLNVGEEITIANATAVDGFSVAALNTSSTIRSIFGTTIQAKISVPNTYSTSEVTAGGGLAAELIFNDNCWLFEHESGMNDYNNNYTPYIDPWENQFAPLNSYVQTNYFQIQEGDNTMLIYSVYPDISQQENMTLTVNVKEFAQDPTTLTQTFTLTPTTTKVDPMMIGRVRQYIFQSNILNGNYLIGRMNEELKPSTPR